MPNRDETPTVTLIYRPVAPDTVPALVSRLVAHIITGGMAVSQHPTEPHVFGFVCPVCRDWTAFVQGVGTNAAVVACMSPDCDAPALEAALQTPGHQTPRPDHLTVNAPEELWAALGVPLDSHLPDAPVAAPERVPSTLDVDYLAALHGLTTQEYAEQLAQQAYPGHSGGVSVTGGVISLWPDTEASTN